jgi:UTP--glucose-1-phosphate uridylyltransferase
MGIDEMSPSSTAATRPRAIRKAVIPAAGLGTRLLPFTKVVPKEMLPLGAKPLIQYAVEEAFASGIEEVILVISPGKQMLEEYFRRDSSLEQLLQKQGRTSDVERLQSLASFGDRIRVAYQYVQLGLGHAVACASELTAGEPFAVILPDALIVGARPCLRQLLDAYARHPGSYLATREVETRDLCRFGILQIAGTVEPGEKDLYRVTGLVEKPTPQCAPSRLGVFGRYLLQPEIFDYIEPADPGRKKEIQLTDALSRYCESHPLYALRFEGVHHDVGDRGGLLQASVELALRDPEFGAEIREYLSTNKLLSHA